MEMLVIGSVIALSLSAMCAGLALATKKGSLSANRVFGLKTRNTVRSDEAWQAGHTAALPWIWATVCFGVSGAVAAIVAGVSGLADAGAIVAWTAVGVSVVVLVLGTFKADKAAAAVTS